jgi:hypothetical protein
MISIVMSTCNRATQLRRTLESIAAQKAIWGLEVVIIDDGNDATGSIIDGWPFPVRYFKISRDKSQNRWNPGPVNNFGVKQAQGSVVILQNAECMHGEHTIYDLVTPLTDKNVVLAHIEYLDKDGNNTGTPASHDFEREGQALFFCGAIRKELFMRLGGFDEDFKLPQCEDNDFSHRLKKEGIEFVYSKTRVLHQWHPVAGPLDRRIIKASQAVLYDKLDHMNRGEIGTVRNIGREWGVL